MKKNCFVKAFILSSTLSTSLMSQASLAEDEVVRALPVSLYSQESIEVRENDDSYLVHTLFDFNGKRYILDVYIDKDEEQSILLFSNEKNREVFKVVVDHRENGSYDFYGYKDITGTISLKDDHYEFTMENKKGTKSDFSILLP